VVAAVWEVMIPLLPTISLLVVVVLEQVVLALAHLGMGKETLVDCHLAFILGVTEAALLVIMLTI
jgi:hypothetical protein